LSTLSGIVFINAIRWIRPAAHRGGKTAREREQSCRKPNFRDVAERNYSILVVISGCSSRPVRELTATFVVWPSFEPIASKYCSFTYDLDVRPAVGLQLLAYLILADRLVVGDEDRPLCAFRFRSDHGHPNQSQ
jgi:hypothetical protein